MANRIDPDEMAHNEPSHPDLHCLQNYPFWSADLKGLKLYIHIQSVVENIVQFHMK